MFAKAAQIIIIGSLVANTSAAALSKRDHWIDVHLACNDQYGKGTWGVHTGCDGSTCWKCVGQACNASGSNCFEIPAGPIDMNAYCQKHYYTNAYNNEGRWDTWRCFE